MAIRRADQVTAIGSTGREYPLELHTGDHIGKSPESILTALSGVVVLEAGGQDHRANVDGHLAYTLLEVDGACITLVDARQTL